MANDRVTSYLPYLPAVLRQSPFLGRFLLAFEAVISRNDAVAELQDPNLARYRDLVGFAQLLDRIHEYFDPLNTDPEFLPWLAQWVATSIRDDWSETTRRNFVANIVPLYRERGTRAGIEKVLALSGDDATVVDFQDNLHKDLEATHFPGIPNPPPAHFFGVILTVDDLNATKLARRARRVRAIVDREKPAHTYYALRIIYPAMRINNSPANAAFGPGIVINNAAPLVLGSKKA